MRQFQPSSSEDIAAVYNPQVRENSTALAAGAAGVGLLPIAWATIGLAAPILSYRRNKSIPWAIGAWLVAPIYVAYRGVEYFTGPEK
jgi:hypothetical protein